MSDSTGGSSVSSGTSYFGIERHVWAWAIGTGFALSAVLISSWLIVQTYRDNRQRLLRRWILLVLLMVPIYSICAWLGLVLKNQTAYWDLLRQCYESVAIWAFFEFLTAYLGGRQHMAGVLEMKEEQKHLPPFCCFPHWSKHRKFYLYTRLCVIQYIPVQIVCSIIIFITSLTGYYEEGDFAGNNAYIYTAFTINCSQIFALYGLVLFYHALKEELKGTDPFWKFLCIKGVVFFTFWQSVFLSMLVAVNVITPTITYTTDQESYDDFVICIEMFLFALFHWYAFPPREFESYRPPSQVLIVSRYDGEKTEISADGQDESTYQLAETEGLAKDRTSIEAKNEAAPTPLNDGPAYTREAEADLEKGPSRPSSRPSTPHLAAVVPSVVSAPADTPPALAEEELLPPAPTEAPSEASTEGGGKAHEIEMTDL